MSLSFAEKLALRCREFVTLRRSVVPQNGVLHERHTFSLDGMRYHAARFSAFEGKSTQRGAELVMVVAVNFDHCPAEASPFVSERLEAQSVRDRLETLHLIVVDDDDEIVQAMVRGKQDGFPVGALIAFSV